MVSGQYVQTFAEASHVVFEGHLDNPAFRAIAIQEIVRVNKASVAIRSGRFAIKQEGREYIAMTYVDIFGRQRTRGHPFKDEHSLSWKERDQSP